ncbi:uncharacterized protein [Nicotiana tomentosiformis]|uniref:uncharacterized protein n=1 Tax=Nicotiana tomentosiformis TaxID=4098 RepID=UPI00388CAC7A
MFTKLFPVHFSGAPSDDPHDYLDRCHEVPRNMGIVETNGVDFAVFQMTGSATRWWKDFVLTRPVGSPAHTWDQFSQIFLEKFLPVTLREDFRRQFERLQHGSMSVTQYETRFVDLGQFQGQQSQQPRSCYTCGDPRHITRFCHRASSSSQHQGCRAMVPTPGASPPAHPARGRGQAARGRGQAARDGGQPAKARPRNIVQSGGPQPRCYDFPARPLAESSDAVITSTVSVCCRDASVLFDPGSTYSYVSSYFPSYLVLPRDSLSAPVYVSTHVGDAIVIDRIYRSCVVTIGNLETSVDLLLLDMACVATGLSAVHPVIHVSMLQKYHGDPSHVLDFSSVQLDKDLTYEEEPVAILAQQALDLAIARSGFVFATSDGFAFASNSSHLRKVPGPGLVRICEQEVAFAGSQCSQLRTKLDICKVELG